MSTSFGIVISSLVGLLLVIPGIVLIVKTGLLKKIPNKETVEGVVYSIDWCPYRVNHKDVAGYEGRARVKYIITDKPYFIDTTFTSASFKENMNLKVIYNKDDPNEAVVKPRFIDMLLGIILVISGLLYIIVCFIIIYNR